MNVRQMCEAFPRRELELELEPLLPEPAATNASNATARSRKSLRVSNQSC
jgi:hypothetical protein